MTNRELRRKVARFRRIHRLNAINYGTLRSAVERQGYTVVEFNHLCNDENIANLITALQLEEPASSTKGFTYADAHQRLVFVHEGLGDAEKTMVLAHEAGHIVCEHFQTAPIIGKDVQDEYEANEFAHYLLNPDSWNKSWLWVKRHAVLFCSAVVAVLLAITVVQLAVAAKTPRQELYVTENGTKYHEKECMTLRQRVSIRAITAEELESGAYEPCEVCLP